MREKILRLFLIIIFIITWISAFAQETGKKAALGITIIDSLGNSRVIFNDSIKSPEIVLSTSQSVKFLQERFRPQYWNDSRDPFRQALGQILYEASHPPFDSAKIIMKTYPYDSLSIPWDKFYKWEPLRLDIPANEVTDTTIMVVVDTLDKVTSSYPGFPFRYFSFPYQADSIKVAVISLLKYLDERDSIIINFTGVGNIVTPVWINSKSDKMTRYWLKNELSDSVTIWIGNPARDTIGLYLEQGINFRRPVKQGNYSAAKINVQSLDNSKLLDVKKIVIKTRYWKYRSETSFILSQSALSNWVKGGENSISTSMDITGYVDYNNKQLKLSSSNFVRLKLGFLKSGDSPVRKNVDLLETNSKLNHKAFGKFDFSAILLFKTQAAPGYNYATEPAELVSKFMNPAALTVGFGLDYKPVKATSINFSPFSYKGTFVTDTAKIDQTNYGIAKDRKSMNEPGASFMITNEYKPVKNVTVTNRLQLFTNYINNPQNIDVDWEMIAVVNLNWFTDVRFNTHLIFDDDTRTVVLDKDKNPVLRPDGSQKKTARIQFKEMLGFSLVFRF
ncbi:MAG: DUF3078 domain-containing protein [Bacteroidota bacterium]